MDKVVERGHWLTRNSYLGRHECSFDVHDDPHGLRMWSHLSTERNNRLTEQCRATRLGFERWMNG